MRAFGPKSADHPSVGEECPACHAPFKAGDWTTLITLGPGTDPDERRKCAAGRAYNAIAIEVHFACVHGYEYEPPVDARGRGEAGWDLLRGAIESQW